MLILRTCCMYLTKRNRNLCKCTAGELLLLLLHQAWCCSFVLQLSCS